MKITAVNMRLVEREKVKAFASITIDDEFVVHDLRIVQGEKGLFVAMPSRRLPNGEFRDVAHPIKSEIREMIQTTVLEEFERQREAVEEAPAPTPTMEEEAAPAPAEEAAPAEEEVPAEEAAPAEEEAPAEEAAPAEEEAAPEEEVPTEEAPTEEAPMGEEPEEVSEEKAREEIPEDPEKKEEPQQ